MTQKSPEQNSLGLSVYLGMAKYTEPLADRRLQKGVSTGEEDPERIDERHGQSNIERKDGQLIWLHAGDLGQSFSMIELIGRIAAILPSAHFLLTTTDRIRERAMAARLTADTVHQYVPYDSPKAVEAFLSHWKPDVCLWGENRLMPVLIKETALADVPLVFLNARLTPQTIKRMRWLPGVAAPVLNSFDEILSIDSDAAEYFCKLGAEPEKITVTGVLSEGSIALPHDESERARISRQLYGRPVWLAAHVHPDEESIVVQAHKATSRVTHRLLTILSPESSSQLQALEQVLKNSNLNIARRSQPESLTPLTDVLLGDVPGELGLWYRIASVSFIGGSLCDAGGQNPFEPAALGSAIIHGPNVENFADSYLRLARAGAAVEVSSPSSLAEAISELMPPDKAAEMAHSAWLACSEGAEVTDRIMNSVLSRLRPPEEGA